MTDANVSEKAYDYVYGLKQTHQDTKLAELATKLPTGPRILATMSLR